MTTLHDFTMNTIDGNPKSLNDYSGKVVLVVNVASKCGLTPQYKGLEALHRELAPRGLVVAGFPANDFGAQEPGTEAEIQTFCSSRYDVTFPMFSKITVKGDGKHALYSWLTEHATPTGEVSWNFEKFLIGRDGKILARFSPRVEPGAPELREAIAKALG
jgi:glutathione peroxidase